MPGESSQLKGVRVTRERRARSTMGGRSWPIVNGCPKRSAAIIIIREERDVMERGEGIISPCDPLHSVSA